MGKIVGVAAVLALLSGCASFDTAKQVVTIKAAQVADEALLLSEYQLCVAASIGSIKRRYTQSIDRANEYNAFCGTPESAVVIISPVE